MTMIRCWHRASQYIKNWITESPERFHYEFQEGTAALPHIYALLTSDQNVFSGNVRSKVCCTREFFQAPSVMNHFLHKKNWPGRFVPIVADSELCESTWEMSKENRPLGRACVSCHVPKYPPSADFFAKRWTWVVCKNIWIDAWLGACWV